MKKCLVLSIVVACLAILLLIPKVGQASRPGTTNVRFAPVHVYLDPGGKPLAAYQFELVAWASRPGSQNRGQDARATGQIKIVGVEGGAHPAFKDAPYYDPAALMNDRIIIAAFNIGADLPTTRTRIATIHLQILGDMEPKYELNLITAGDTDAQEVPAELTLESGARK
jgi:hypothetical protein